MRSKTGTLSTLSLLLLLPFFSCSKDTKKGTQGVGQPPEASPLPVARPEVVAEEASSDIETLIAALRGLRGGPDSSYHCLLRDISRATQDHRQLANDWREINNAVVARGGKLIDS